jgi:hypothetical protein
MNREYTVWKNSESPVHILTSDFKGLAVVAFIMMILYLLN